MLKRILCSIVMLVTTATFIIMSAATLPSGVLANANKGNAQKEATAFDKPDFAFPQTVINNAEVELHKAASDNNEERIIQCAIQLVIANNSISTDRMPQMARMLDSIATHSSVPTAAILYSLEAELYQQAYNANRSQYDSRTLPLNEYPANPTLWSKQLYAKKVLSLADASLAHDVELQGTSSAAYKEIMADLNESTIACYPTLYSILADRGLRLLSTFADSNGVVIPFGSKEQSMVPTQECALRKYDISHRWNEAAVFRGDVAEIAVSMKALNDNTPGLGHQAIFVSYLSAYKQYARSPYSTEFLVCASRLSNDKTESTELYPLIKEALAAYPNAAGVNELTNFLGRADNGTGTLKVSSLFTPQQDVVAEVVTENMPSGMYACVFSVPTSENIYREYKEGRGKLVVSKQMEVTTDTTHISFGKLPVGNYVIIVAADAQGKNRNKYGNDYGIFTVTNYSINIIHAGNASMVQVVNPMDGKPQVNAEVTFTSGNNSASKKYTSLTNEYGIADIPSQLDGTSSIKASIKDGDDFASQTFWRHNTNKGQSRKSALVLTDLALYHPADTCQFTVIAYKNDYSTSKQSALPGQKLSAKLRNASYVVCDSVALTTDQYGRASGQFILPKGGMNGQFTIEVNDESSRLGNGTIRVEEYKQPTFYVELDKVDTTVPPAPMKISGKVMTYSGMPVTNADVKVTIQLQPYYWRYSTVQGSYTEDTCTDTDGKFELSLTTDRLADTEFENQRYVVNVTATSAAGESQQAEPVSTYIGNKILLKYVGKESVNIDNGSLTLPFELVGDNITNKPLTYVLLNADNQEILSGESQNTTIIAEVTNLASGRYTIKAYLDNAATCDHITLYRTTDKIPPTQTALWIPERELTAPIGSKTISVAVGSSFADTHIYYIVSNEDKVLDQGLLLPQGGILHVDLPSPTKRNSRTWVNFSTMDSCTYYSGVVTVTPSTALESVQVEKLSFRDKINAGGKERWTFRYTLADKPLAELPVIATLTDKSLNAITPFSWQPAYQLSPSPIVSISGGRNKYPISLFFNYSPYKNLPVAASQTPDIYTYGMNLYGTTLRIRGTQHLYSRAAGTSAAGNDEVVYEEVMPMMMSMNATADAGVATKQKMEVYDMASSDEFDDFGSGDNTEQVSYRPAEMPLAWFKPALTTDGSGILELSFYAPDYNTTWQLQMLGYTPEMLGNLFKADIVASKPVMVSANAPRFLRTGDRVLLAAMVYNNSDTAAMTCGHMEIFNPLNNEVITTKEFAAEEVAAMGSRHIAIEFTAPADVEFVGYRVLGTVPGFSDGEQSLIAILPSSSPVTESYPFYMSPSANTFSMTLPEFSADNMTDVQVSLQYCDNPIWECVTALPDMSFDKDASILSCVNRLYGNSISAGLMKQYPQIAEALKVWSDTSDNTLMSDLQKNEELKTVALANTPWVLNAQAETLRKARLVNLLDTGNCQTEIDNALNKLKNEQASDGGWSWCPGMESSLFITEQVLWRLAMLHSMGYLDMNKARPLVNNALRYCDNELYQEYIKAKRQFSTTGMLNYLYIRSFFPGMSATGNFATLKNRAVKAIKDEWKQFDIYNKATAATLMAREKEPMLARTILESLNQLASRSAERGMWFDNLRSGTYGYNTLISTTQALEAFNEVTPDSEAVDALRQWLIIERQAQDWGQDAQLAEVIYAILTSGSDWTDASSPARIFINNNEVSPTETDKFTGAFTVALNPDDASGAALRIEKYGTHQSWGGIIAKYIAPIQSVKEFSQSDVTVQKAVLMVDESENGTSVTPLTTGKLKVGQHVRVRLIVTSERDIEYAVITDERGGCLMPDNQLSRYTRQDGIGYYLEVKNDVTNMFIPRLPKGDFIIEYDCHVSQEGTFSTGIATVQSLYAPTLSAHSAGSILDVTK